MPNALTILHLTDRLSHRGGADWHLLGVIHESQKHRSVLAVGRCDPGVSAPCPIHTVPGLDARTPTAVDLDSLVDAVRPDRIHVHNVVNPTALSWAAEHDALMTVQDHRSFCPGRGKWKADGAVCTETFGDPTCRVCFEDNDYYREILAVTSERLAAVRRMAGVIVLSDYMQSELMAAGVPAEQIHVIPPFIHGLDTAAKAIHPPCLLFVGRLVDAKGVWDTVHAWRQAHMNLPLVFVGAGPLSAALRDEGFHTTGWVDRTTLSQWYASAKAVIVPSRWQEPFGIVGLEAAAFGLPVIATASGGIPEWHPGPGRVEPGDVDALSQAILHWQEAAVPSNEAYDPPRLMRRLHDLYESNSGARFPTDTF